MKLTIDTTDLLNGLQKVAAVAPSHGALPVLCNVLLTADADSIQLRTTDLELDIATIIAADVEEPGRITLPARRLTQIIACQVGETVTLAVNEGIHEARISCGAAHYTIMGLASDEFPAVPAAVVDTGFTLDAQALMNALCRVNYAATTDTSRHVLCGVHLACESKILTVTATDGRRLARHTIPVDAPDFDCILPAKAVKQLLRTLDQQQVTVNLAEGRIGFRFGDTRLATKLVEGAFPNTDAVIPKDLPQQFQLPSSFCPAVKRVATIVPTTPRSMQLAIRNDQIRLTAAGADIGEGEEIIDTATNGADLQMAFNPDYLLQALTVLDSADEVTFQAADGAKPVVLTTGDYLAVVMPLRN